MSKKPKSYAVGDITIRKMAGPKHGCWRWRAEWYLPNDSGKINKMSTTSLGWLTKKAAFAVAGKMLSEGLPDKNTVKQLFTVEELLDEWISYQYERPEEECSMNSIKARVSSAKRLLGSKNKPRLRGLTIKDLTNQATLIRFVRDYLKEGRAVNTLEGDIKCLRQAIDWGHLNKHIKMTLSDVPKVKLPPKPTPHNSVPYSICHRMPTNEECEMVYSHIKCPRKALAFLMVWYTGARIGSVLSMCWGDIDMKNRTITFVRTKNKQVRKIPFPPGAPGRRLHAELVRNLRNGTDDTDSIFFEHGRVPARPENSLKLNKQIKESCEVLEIERFTPHAMRHLAVNTMIRRGVDVSTAAYITGHDVKTMMKYYRFVNEEEVQIAMNQARFGSLDN